RTRVRDSALHRIRVGPDLAARDRFSRAADRTQLLLSLARRHARPGRSAAESARAGRRTTAARDESHRPRARADVPRGGQRLFPAEPSGAFPATRLLYSRSLLRARGRMLPMARARIEARGKQRRFAVITICTRFQLLIVALCLALPAAADTDPIVDAPAGKVRGAVLGDLHVFKGIPYALPPTGSRRWKPPLPMPAWKETRDATRFGAPCVQPNPRSVSIYAHELPPTSEDCLFLNIW